MWLFFAFLSGALYTVQGLLTRYILKGKRDAWAFSFFFSFVGALTALPFMLGDSVFSSDLFSWGVMMVVGGLIVLTNYLGFKATNYLEASIQGSVAKFRLLWVLLIGVMFLGESLSISKIVGTVLTVMAGVIVLAKAKKINSKIGVGLTLASTVSYAVVIGLYKLLFSEFNSVTLTFFIFAIPAVINLIVMPNSIKRVKNMAKTQGLNVFIATFFGGLANLAMNHSLSIGEASRVLVIIEAFLIVVLMGEHSFLKEKSGFKKKVIAVILATTGAVLIRL